MHIFLERNLVYNNQNSVVLILLPIVYNFHLPFKSSKCFSSKMSLSYKRAAGDGNILFCNSSGVNKASKSLLP